MAIAIVSAIGGAGDHNNPTWVQSGVTGAGRFAIILGHSYLVNTGNPASVGSVGGCTVGGIAGTQILTVTMTCVPFSGATITFQGKVWIVPNPPNGTVVVSGTDKWGAVSWRGSGLDTSGSYLGTFTHDEGDSNLVVGSPITVETGNRVLQLFAAERAMGVGSGSTNMFSQTQSGSSGDTGILALYHSTVSANWSASLSRAWVLEQQELIAVENSTSAGGNPQVFVNMLGIGVN